MPRRRHVATFGHHRFVVEGLSSHAWGDLHHHALTVSWPIFFAGAAAIFVAVNLCFGLFYWLDSGSVAHLAPHDFAHAFFFSVETLATVGYGQMHPQSLYGHAVASVEMFVGLSSIALLTGLTFKRFSRPRARFIFAQHPVVHCVYGVPTLVIRVGNERQNVIAGASARLFLVRLEISPEDVQIYRAIELKLMCDTQPELMLGWSLMHVIDRASPLNGVTAGALAAADASLVLIVDGIDEATSQPMMARHRWESEAIFWNHRYGDMVRKGDDGVEVIDFRMFQRSFPLDSTR